MADLGIYNFIKNALARGETKEQIEAALAKGGHSKETIDETIAAVERGDVPKTQKPPSVQLFAPNLGTLKNAPRPISSILLVTILLLAIGAGVAYYYQYTHRAQPIVVNGKSYTTWWTNSSGTYQAPFVTTADADALSNGFPNGNVQPTDCSKYLPDDQPKVISTQGNVKTTLEQTFYQQSKSACLGLYYIENSDTASGSVSTDEIVYLPDNKLLMKCDKTVLAAAPGSTDMQQNYTCSYNGVTADMLRGDAKPTYFPLSPNEVGGGASFWDKLSRQSF